MVSIDRGIIRGGDAGIWNEAGTVFVKYDASQGNSQGCILVDVEDSRIEAKRGSRSVGCAVQETWAMMPVICDADSERVKSPSCVSPTVEISSCNVPSRWAGRNGGGSRLYVIAAIILMR